MTFILIFLGLEVLFVFSMLAGGLCHNLSSPMVLIHYRDAEVYNVVLVGSGQFYIGCCFNHFPLHFKVSFTFNLLFILKAQIDFIYARGVIYTLYNIHLGPWQAELMFSSDVSISSI